MPMPLTEVLSVLESTLNLMGADANHDALPERRITMMNNRLTKFFGTEGAYSIDQAGHWAGRCKILMALAYMGDYSEMSEALRIRTIAQMIGEIRSSIATA